MGYTITYEMAVELVHRYLEKIHILNKHKGTSSTKVQQLYQYNTDLKQLVSQLKEDGYDAESIISEIKEGLEKKYSYDKLTVFVDGAARGNNDTEKNNSSAIGFAIYGDSEIIYEQGKYLGSDVVLPKLKNEPSDIEPLIAPATNNTCEYLALILALEYMIEHGMNAKHIEIFSDSRMVVTQVNYVSTTKAPHLIRLRDCALELMDEFENMTISFIPRDENVYVDALINSILDEEEGKQDE